METNLNIETGRLTVKAVIRSGNWLPSSHDGSFMYTGASAQIAAPMSRNTRRIANFLNKDEQEWIERELGYEPGRMSTSREKDNYWAKYFVRLTKDDRTLDLSIVGDYIDYKVLKANTDLIAPSWATRFSRGTIRWALVRDEEEVNIKVNTGKFKREAYANLTKIVDNSQRMYDVLMVYYMNNNQAVNPPAGAAKDFYEAMCNDICERDAKGFNMIFEDKFYEDKLLVKKGLIYGHIERSASGIVTIKGTRLAGTELEVSNQLRSPANQEARTKLFTQVSNSEAGRQTDPSVLSPKTQPQADNKEGQDGSGDGITPEPGAGF